MSDATIVSVVLFVFLALTVLAYRRLTTVHTATPSTPTIHIPTYHPYGGRREIARRARQLERGIIRVN